MYSYSVIYIFFQLAVYISFIEVRGMKIGILTFRWSQDNYGQLLQCYALPKYLRDRGHESFLIRYDWTKDVKKNPLWARFAKALNPVLLARYVRSKRRLSQAADEQKKYSRRFDNFRSKYIMQSENCYSSYTDLHENPPDADAYIVGSDQVWNYWFENPKRFYSQIHAYFLDFGGDETKRPSYAASWGVTELPGAFCTVARPLLSRFDYISVREESGMNAWFDSLFALRGTGERYVSDIDFSVLDVPYEVKAIVPSVQFLKIMEMGQHRHLGELL